MRKEQYENSKPIEANRTEVIVFCKHLRRRQDTDQARFGVFRRPSQPEWWGVICSSACGGTTLAQQ